MDRGLELWNNKVITTTLTVSGTVRTAVGRDIWSKILDLVDCDIAGNIVDLCYIRNAIVMVM